MWILSQKSEETGINLFNCEQNVKFFIESIDLDMSLKIRMGQLGFECGKRIKKIRNPTDDNILVKLGKHRYKIDQNLAKKVKLVEKW